jgi:hypothetical protein
MNCIFHLKSQGWWDHTCAENERLETWKVEIEHFGSSRIIRWACTWRAGSLDTETRRLLHRRFGSPPMVTVPMETGSEAMAVDTTGAIAV